MSVAYVGHAYEYYIVFYTAPYWDADVSVRDQYMDRHQRKKNFSLIDNIDES